MKNSKFQMLYEEIMMSPANRPNIDPETQTPPNNPQRKTENISETDIKVIQTEFGKNAEYNGTFIWQYRNIFLTFYKTVEQKSITYNFILFGKQEENQENNEQPKIFDSVELERGGFHSLKAAIKNAQAKIEQIVDGTPFKKINDPVCPQCGSALPDPGEIYYDCPKCGKIHKYKIEKK